jgi:hypothetical protein
MNTAYENAIKEAYAVCPRAAVVLDTLEVRHPSLDESIYLVRNIDDVVAALETAEVVTFRACGFKLSLPASGADGVQEMSLVIDNTDRRVSDFLMSAVTTNIPVKLVYRPYLYSDLTAPQMNPPLELELKDVNIGLADVSGRATFFNLQNSEFPRERYTRRRFPSLGQ